AVQQRLVLAVRLTHLEAVDAGVLVDRHVTRIEDLDHRRQPELATGLDDEREPPLEGLGVRRAEPFPAAVGARPVLDDPAAQALAARLLHHAGRLDDLRLALDRARAGDDDELVPAADDGADRDGLVDGLVGRPLLRRALVRLGDGDELLDARELLDRKSTRLNSSHVAISYAVFCL